MKKAEVAMVAGIIAMLPTPVLTVLVAAGAVSTDTAKSALSYVHPFLFW